MTIPAVVFLHIGGNVALFWGFFKILSLTVFKRGAQKEPLTGQHELRKIERELRRL
jgi:hypothetical protein